MPQRAASVSPTVSTLSAASMVALEQERNSKRKPRSSTGSQMAPSSKKGTPASSVTWLAAITSGLAKLPKTAPTFSVADQPLDLGAAGGRVDGVAFDQLDRPVEQRRPRAFRSSAASSRPR